MDRETIVVQETKSLGKFAEGWLRFRSDLGAVAGLGILAGLVIMSVLGPVIIPEDPIRTNLSRALEPPGVGGLLGRDELGRDILSRIVHGAPVSLGIGIFSVMIGASVGVVLGLVSGYFGNKTDTVIQRIADVLLSFPSILLALSLVAALGVGLVNVIIAVGVSTIPVYIKLVRGQVLTIKNEDFVKAVRLLGLSPVQIMVKHIMPNVLPVVVVQSTYYIGFTILVASGLGFLGLGVQPPTPEWGAMLGGGRTYIFSAPHILIFPGLMIFITILAFNMVGDGLRAALDPKAPMIVTPLGRKRK
ncbi:MAG: ABC transporter permease [Candidatus Caldarchaeum sp.]